MTQVIRKNIFLLQKQKFVFKIFFFDKILPHESEQGKTLLLNKSTIRIPLPNICMIILYINGYLIK